VENKEREGKPIRNAAEIQNLFLIILYFWTLYISYFKKMGSFKAYQKEENETKAILELFTKTLEDFRKHSVSKNVINIY